jgi:hypothetical protein
MLLSGEGHDFRFPFADAVGADIRLFLRRSARIDLASCLMVMRSSSVGFFFGGIANEPLRVKWKIPY